MSVESDKFNNRGAISPATVDQLNRDFYGQITYPWPQMTYPVYADPKCGLIFLNQELGDWSHTRVPRRTRIWVAGCGSNQATLTALKFPRAEILATDISAPSLAVCEKNLKQLNIKNVRLQEQSLNDANYAAEFDYVICTGVIHHNADPAAPLRNLSAALTSDGILELGVYNYYHRILTTAYQKAMQYLFTNDERTDLDDQLAVTKQLMNKFPVENTMSFYLRQQSHGSREYIADSFLQPVEHSYTVESLVALLESCGLVLCLPCVSIFDKDYGQLSWNLEFEDKSVAERYDALEDFSRWQITNLLAVEKSPILSFYAQPQKSSFPRRSEKEVCEEFLNTSFERYSTTVTNYVGGNGSYKLSGTPVPHPSPRVPIDALAREVFKAVEPDKTMRDVLQGLKIEPNFYLVNRLRTQLTTPLFPYLKARPVRMSYNTRS
jgi:SAM-dependent methyltransferase